MRLNLMIDLETLGTGHRSVVTQLGWATFDLEGREEGPILHGCYTLDPQQQLDMGRKADWSTIAWWLNQSQDARDAMREGPCRPLGAVLSSFRGQHDWEKVEGVWGHGATFDITLLESLHADMGLKAPWGFREVRDTRTLFAFAPAVEWPTNPVKHDAEKDAIAQAIAVQRAVWALEGRGR